MPRCTVYSDSSVPCGYIIARVWRRHHGPDRRLNALIAAIAKAIGDSR